MRQKLFIYTLLGALPLSLLHIAALHFSLYWIFSWFDCLTHFLGGLTTAFLCAALLYPVMPKRYLIPLLLILVLLVGVGWEIFEYVSGLTFHERNYWQDTRSDLLFDLLGGGIGVYLTSRILDTYGTFRN